MSQFKIGSVDPLSVQAFSGFTYPERATILPLLGNGTDAGNGVVQSSALVFPEAVISGTLTDSNDVSALQGYAQDKSTTVTLTEDDGSTTHEVVVFDLVVTRIYISVWTYSCRLVEVA